MSACEGVQQAAARARNVVKLLKQTDLPRTSERSPISGRAGWRGVAATVSSAHRRRMPVLKYIMESVFMSTVRRAAIVFER